jgi:RNA polymerase sigma-70 factor, ECF subfamily
MTLGNDCVVAMSVANSIPAPVTKPKPMGGDRESLTELATSLLPRVRNLIRYLVRGDQDVDDIAQDALIAVLRGMSSYRGLGSFESWSDRVVARTTFAWLKRHRKQHEISGEHCSLEPSDDQQTQPDEYLRRRRLVLLLDQLPYEQRHALILHHVLGLSVTEVAEECGAHLETVRTRLRLGKSKLRALGSDDAGEQESSQ